MGDNDLLLDLLDADGVRLDDATLTATARLSGPDGVAGDALTLEPIQLASRGRTPYRTPVSLDAIGDWSFTVDARTGDGRTLSGEGGFPVLPDGGTPALGQAVVPVDTPTIESSGYDLAIISTDPDPLPTLYLTSVRDALRLKHAFVLVIDTVGLGVNNACGSGVGEARTIPLAFPGLWVIHAEPWVNPSGEGAGAGPHAQPSPHRTLGGRLGRDRAAVVVRGRRRRRLVAAHRGLSSSGRQPVSLVTGPSSSRAAAMGANHQ